MGVFRVFLLLIAILFVGNVGAQFGGFPQMGGGVYPYGGAAPLTQLSSMNAFNPTLSGYGLGPGAGYPTYVYTPYGVANPNYAGSNSLGLAGWLPRGIGGTNPYGDLGGLGATLSNPFGGKAYFGRRRR